MFGIGAQIIYGEYKLWQKASKGKREVKNHNPIQKLSLRGIEKQHVPYDLLAGNLLSLADWSLETLSHEVVISPKINQETDSSIIYPLPTNSNPLFPLQHHLPIHSAPPLFSSWLTVIKWVLQPSIAPYQREMKRKASSYHLKPPIYSPFWHSTYSTGSQFPSQNHPLAIPKTC